MIDVHIQTYLGMEVAKESRGIMSEEVAEKTLT
jgi:hypothetical protein